MRRLNLPGLSVVLACACASGIAPAATMRLTDCEFNLCGGDWTLNGREGSARWPTGTVAELTVERWEPDHIVIHRKDVGGPTVGVTAVYTGVLSNDRIDGKVIYEWPGHWSSPQSANWGAALEYRERAPPPAVEGTGPLPDLNGVWQFGPESGALAGVAFSAVQNGTGILTLRTVPGQPVVIAFRGAFKTRTTILGHSCGPSAHAENPNCLPETVTMTIVDSSHVKDSYGVALHKIAGPQDPRYARGLAFARDLKPYLRDEPFELTGSWQSEEQRGPTGRVDIVQHDGLVTIAYPGDNRPVFSGR